METPKPAWWALYMLLPSAAVLLFAASLWIPAGAGRMVAEATISLAILRGIALWVRANRVALVLRDATGREMRFRVWVAYQPPAPRRRHHAPQTSVSLSQMAA